MNSPTLLTDPLPPDATWTNGRLEQQPRPRSIYEDFTEIEAMLIVAGGHGDLGHFDQARTAIRVLAGKVLALKERVCAATDIDAGGAQ